MPQSEQPAYRVPMVVMHDAETGRRVAISAMWLLYISETDDGSLFVFRGAETVAVSEPLETIIAAYGGLPIVSAGRRPSRKP